MNFYVFSFFAIFLVYDAQARDSRKFENIIKKVNSENSALWKAEKTLHDDTILSLYENLKDSEYLYEDEKKIFETPNSHEKGNGEEIVGHGGPYGHFDARKAFPHCPSIKKIWDQGNCAAGWVIGPVSAITDRICIASNGTWTKTLSPQTPLSCCKHCGFGCRKGYAGEVWKYWVEYGLVTGGDYASHEGCQPYTIAPCSHYSNHQSLPICKNHWTKAPHCKHRCYNKNHENNFENDLIKGEEAFSICTCCMWEDIVDSGPISATFLLYEDFLHYKSGIYHHVAGERVGLHTVRVIGWGEENEVKYWIAANSWNTEWGENGFFRILRGNDECWFEGAMQGGSPKLK